MKGFGEIYNFATKQHLVQYLHLNDAALALSLTSSTFYDVICLTERHDQFEHANCSKETFCERCIFIHECISIRGCALFSLWNFPHHGRPKTVENKGSNVRYNKINTAPRLIITFLGMISELG